MALGQIGAPALRAASLMVKIFPTRQESGLANLTVQWDSRKGNPVLYHFVLSQVPIELSQIVIGKSIGIVECPEYIARGFKKDPKDPLRVNIDLTMKVGKVTFGRLVKQEISFNRLDGETKIDLSWTIAGHHKPDFVLGDQKAANLRHKTANKDQ